MFLRRLPIKRLLLLWTVSAAIALLCTIGLLFCIPTDRDAPPPPVLHDIPAERLCRTPATTSTTLPDSIASTLPHLRLIETASGRQYELHYWGNPVRPKYTYSIRKLSNNATLLRNPQGKPQKSLPLPVTTPHRADNRLPHQPPVLIPLLPGPADAYFAARVSVHDAATGKVLCSEVYLLHGSH